MRDALLDVAGPGIELVDVLIGSAEQPRDHRGDNRHGDVGNHIALLALADLVQVW